LYLALQLNFYEYKYFPTLVRRFSPDYCKSKEEISELSKESATIANFEFYLKESEDLLCIAGIDGFYKEVNPAFLKIIGYTKQELLSVSMTSFIHPDDRLKPILK
jgi:PAS domain-containing protein